MSSFTFRVSPLSDPRVHRTIEASGSATLSALHHAITSAFKYDGEHAHAFFLNGHPWDAEFGLWSMPDRGQRGTRDTSIESLDLVERKRILYLFDFDDEHHFDVRVTRIARDSAGPDVPTLIESAGEAPAQYAPADQDEPEVEEDLDDEARAERDEQKRQALLAAAEPTLADLAERVRDCIEYAEALIQAEYEELDEDFEDRDEADQDDEDTDGDSTPADYDPGAAESGEGSASLAASGEEDEDEEGEEGPSAEDEAALAEELLERFGAEPERISKELEPLVDADVFNWLESVPQRLSEEGDPDRALELAQRIVKLPWSDSLRAILPRLAVRADRPDEALSLIEIALKNEPEDPEILLQIALTFDELEQDKRAEQYYREALRFAGSDMELRSEIIEHLVELLRGMDQNEEASKVMQAEVLHTQRFTPLFSGNSPSEPFRHVSPKVGRNDPCPCGSGKKFKKCCGLN